jgi:4-amino-4-deoxy-L-arabinose transferase-like glycosyltransferase
LWLDTRLFGLTRGHWLVAALALVFALLAAGAARRSSLTFDELAYIPAGHAQWLTGAMELNPEHPPLAKWLAGLLPWLLEPRFDPSSLPGFAELDQWRFGVSYFTRPGVAVETNVYLGRLPTVWLGGALVLVVAMLARRLMGSVGAVAAALACATCPPLLGHFSLATTDGCVTFFSLLALERAVALALAPVPTVRGLVTLGLSVGAALASKQTAVALPLGLAASGLAWVLSVPGSARIGRAKRAAFAGAITLGIAALVLGVTSLGTGLGNYLGDLRVTNAGYQSYLHGHFSAHFPQYFVFALIVKLGLPLLALGLVGWVIALGTERDMAFAWLGLGATLVAFVVVVSVTMFGTGVRYVLPVVPLLCLGAARAVVWLGAAPFSRVVLAGLLLWSCGDIALARFRYVAWFNQAAGGSERGSEWLDDSNVDWGQGLLELRAWLNRQPPNGHGRPPELYLTQIVWYPPTLYGLECHWITLEGMIIALDFAPPDPGVYALSEHLWNRLRAAPPDSAAHRLFARAPDERVGPFRIFRVPERPPG